jgi:hypothetical protein
MLNTFAINRFIENLFARLMICALIVLGLSSGYAKADYQRPDKDPPTPADLVTVDTLSKTLVIQMLNLTPYTITAAADTVPTDNTDMDRNTKKSMILAPVGWPKTLPPLNGSWTTDANGLQMFVPDREANNTVHPLSFVVGWDGRGKYVDHSAIGWTIEKVDNIGHSGATQDVPLRFWFTRTKPESILQSGLFKLISEAVFEAIHLVTVLVEPGRVLPGIESFVGLLELAEGADEFSEKNSTDTGGAKMYFAAYVVPDNCLSGDTCTPAVNSSVPDQSSDAADVQWGTIDGEFSANLVVSTLMIRGQDYEASMSTYGPLGGQVPIVSVTIMTAEDYAYSLLKSKSSPLTAFPSGNTLKRLLSFSDNTLSEYRRFVSIYRSLTSSELMTLKEIMQHRRHQKRSHEQNMLIKKMTEAMHKGQKGGKSPHHG